MADIDTFDGALAAVVEWSEAICRRDPELARLKRRGRLARRLLESAWEQAYEAGAHEDALNDDAAEREAP